MDQPVKTASPFTLSPDDPLNDLRMSAKAIPLYEHVKRFIAEVVNPMSAQYEVLGRNRHGADRWVFSVEQVAGVIRVGQATLRAVPATVSQSGARFCQALFDWQGVIVGILDETRFLDGLNDQVRST